MWLNAKFSFHAILDSVHYVFFTLAIETIEVELAIETLKKKHKSPRVDPYPIINLLE